MEPTHIHNWLIVDLEKNIFECKLCGEKQQRAIGEVLLDGSGGL